MENRYLFRGKRIDNGEWVEGFYFCMTHPDGRHIHHFIIPLGADLSLGTAIEKIQVEIDQSTICQCTGLKDKNVKLIWENDICRYYNFKDGDGIGIIKNGYILWKKGTISVKHKMTPLFYLQCHDEWEVIGNIFDSPELLEV